MKKDSSKTASVLRILINKFAADSEDSLEKKDWKTSRAEPDFKILEKAVMLWD